MIFSVVNPSWATGVLDAGVGAMGMFLIGTVTVFFQQRNRSQDRADARTVERVSEAQGEIRTAFDAWQSINVANATMIASLTARLDLTEERARKCEEETVPALLKEMEALRGEVRRLEAPHQ